MSNKATKEFWDKNYEPAQPKMAAEDDIVRQWLETNIAPLAKNNKKTCIEIGCYPGQYLSIFGELGYALYGIDYCEQIGKLEAYLQKSGYTVGKIWKEDFLNFNPSQKFDIVASFGFVEHFTDYQEVIGKHIELLNDQGYLILEAPNFIGGFQRWLHHTFDRTNYDRHHVPAMDIEKWIDTIEHQGLSIIYAGYFGKFHYWVDNEHRNRLQKLFLRTLKNNISPILEKILPKDKKCYSPFGGVIAQKQ